MLAMMITARTNKPYCYAVINKQGVVFLNSAALAGFLDIVLADPDARVVRVKNRMRPDFDVINSAGFR